jgi:hypothetical protein
VGCPRRPSLAPKNGSTFSNTLAKFLEKIWLHGYSESTIRRKTFLCSAVISARSFLANAKSFKSRLEAGCQK